jgi:hypothetical protein
MLGDCTLRPIETGQKNAGRFANPVGNHRALVQLKFNRGPDQLLRHFEQLLGQRHQLVRRQPAMTLVHRLGERVGNPGANPNQGSLLDAELHGYCIGSLETNAANIAGEPVRVL